MRTYKSGERECEAVVNPKRGHVACYNRARYQCRNEHLLCGVHARRRGPIAPRRCKVCNAKCKPLKA